MHVTLITWRAQGGMGGREWQGQFAFQELETHPVGPAIPIPRPTVLCILLLLWQLWP